jgi:hypothetical protein
MRKRMAPMVLALLLAGAGASGQGEPRRPALAAAIDGVVPRHAAVADDGEFYRRLMIDLVGYPPSGEQAKAFLADAGPQKRVAKIEELLASDDWADYWSRMFAEVFFGNYHDVRMDTTPPVSRPASARIVGDFVKWLKMKLAKDRPWTEIVAEILDARGSDVGDPALAYKLALFTEEGPDSEFATNVSRHFLGVRLLCAKCHDHPFEPQYTVSHYYGLAAFNVRMRARARADGVEIFYAPAGEARIVDVEIMSDIVKRTGTGEAEPIWIFGGQAPPGPGVDRVRFLIQFVTSRNNPLLSKALANRIWGWLFGRGIVHPVDDFSRRNKPLNASLLERLADAAVEKKHSIKELLRGILNSGVYQLSCAGEGTAAKADFSRGAIKPLNGEQLIHSLQVATKGRPERNFAQVMQMVASLFPAGAVWCETTALPGNARQALLLRNNSEIMGWITGGGVLAKIKGGGGTIEEKIDEMFLAALTRRATDSEKKRYRGFIESHPAQGFEDAYWTILNTAEFVTRH